MNEQEPLDAYVLTRIYNNYAKEDFEARFRAAVSSVAQNAVDYQDGKVRRSP